MVTLRKLESNGQQLYDLGDSFELLESLESHLPDTESLHSRVQGNLDGR